jgi:hypothetical protein
MTTTAGGRQKINCECKGVRKKLAWTGEYHGVMECRELGWYAKFIYGSGWVSCDKDDDGATEDLNKLMALCTWDKVKGKFVLLT